MLRDHGWIATHVPHQGAMCLLDEVLYWDAKQARCLTRAHRSPANPLRSHGQLGAVCGIEFAAQAMAVHGALLIPDPSAGRRPGRLVSLREVLLHTTRLDDIEDDLIAVVVRLGGDEATVLYAFSLNAGSRVLITGRAAIVVDRTALAAAIDQESP